MNSFATKGSRAGMMPVVTARLLSAALVSAALVSAALIGTAFIASGPAQAADWPTKPVRIIVPYGAGGAADTLGRLFGEPLSRAFGQQFYIENRAGGGGLTGSEMLAKSDPDGSSIGIVGMATHVIAPAMNKNVTIDPIADFTHIAYLGGAPNVFVVHPTYGVKTFKDFLAGARTAKDGINYVSPGLGSVGNLVAEYLASKEKIKLVHVPYKGGATALQDLIAGHVKVGMMSYSTAGEQVRSGKLIPIAISSENRVPDLPDVPTLKELGYADLVATTWWAVSGPKGMPADIVARINKEIGKALTEPAIARALKQDAVEVSPLTPEQTTALMKSEVEKWVPVIKSAIKP